MEGKTNPIEDVGIRLVHGLHDFGADLPALAPHLAPLPQKARERLSKGWTQGRDGVWGAVEALREDWGKRQAAAAAGGAGGGAQVEKAEGADGDKAKELTGLQEPPLSPAQIGGTFLAGVDVARTGAQQLAAGLGGFLGGAARRTSFFGTGAGAGAGAGSAPPSAAASEADTASPPPSATLPVPGQQLQQQQAGAGRFLRPLSTAAAATVPTSPPLGGPAPSPPRAAAPASTAPSLAAVPGPSTSTSPSPSPAPNSGGFSGFFGGLRRIANPSVANLSASASSSSAASVSTPSTPAGFGTPPPLSFLGVGGWGGRAAGGGSASSLALKLPERTARDVAGDLGADHSDDEDEDGAAEVDPVVRGAGRIRLQDVELEGEEDRGAREKARDEARRRLEGGA